MSFSSSVRLGSWIFQYFWFRFPWLLIGPFVSLSRLCVCLSVLAPSPSLSSLCSLGFVSLRLSVCVSSTSCFTLIVILCLNLSIAVCQLAFTFCCFCKTSNKSISEHSAACESALWAHNSAWHQGAQTNLKRLKLYHTRNIIINLLLASNTRLR